MAQQKPVDPGFREHEGGKFSCMVCEPYHGRKLIGWPALPGHLRSDNHTSSLHSSLHAQEEHTAELAREEQLHAEWSKAFLASWSAPVNPPTSSQNDGYPHDLPSYHFDDDVLISLGDALVSSAALVMADEYEQFQLGTAMRLAKSLRIGHTTLSTLLEFGDKELVDSTMTNVMQNAVTILIKMKSMPNISAFRPTLLQAVLKNGSPLPSGHTR
ncbi:hypothetical protein JAAARDRAFT_195724 [Jaapia argillacea MUCL 33604]|uniref:Uncharacterized protein n=1 Tax=Jaapia argillacea MUCL 33604 TaxID=933084 RepID=A0A067PVL4_9AGAM|nr:hypothetical protein JAAARDRAFT_195724 [Jaapia argillacea MUCL 33604]